MNRKVYLIFVCLVSTLGGFLFGYDTAVISGTLSFVRTQFSMSSLLEGWFVGSALLGCVVGVAFAGFLADFFGRKKTLFLAAFLLVISAIGCTIPRNLTELIIFRLIGGLGVGIASMLSPLYISEISLAEVRGRMVSLYQFAITIGILFAYFANTRILNFGQHANFAPDSIWHWIFTAEVWRSMFGAEAIPGILFILRHEPAGTFRYEEEQNNKENAWNGFSTKHSPPDFGSENPVPNALRGEIRVLPKV